MRVLLGFFEAGLFPGMYRLLRVLSMLMLQAAYTSFQCTTNDMSSSGGLPCFSPQASLLEHLVV